MIDPSVIGSDSFGDVGYLPYKEHLNLLAHQRQIHEDWIIPRLSILLSNQDNQATVIGSLYRFKNRKESNKNKLGL